jgi:hypothetical protein
MAKAPALVVHSSLRTIPSVERILSAEAFAALIREFGRERVKEAVVDHLTTVRATRMAYDEGEAVAAVGAAIAAATRSTLRRVINGTGVIIHTNLGRSPIHPSIWSEAQEIVSGYSNLEFDVEKSARARRAPDRDLPHALRLRGRGAGEQQRRRHDARPRGARGRKEVIVSRGSSSRSAARFVSLM